MQGFLRAGITQNNPVLRNGDVVNVPRRRAEEAYLLGEVTRIFQLDTSTPTGLLLGTRFVLEPGDVVHVVRSPLQCWNDTISRLLPTVQAISVADDLAN